jgi:hypothetical protein
MYSLSRDIIVKFTRLEDAKQAYESLKTHLAIDFVPTKHNSEDFGNFNYLRTETYDNDAREATITLNILKIKKPNFMAEKQVAHDLGRIHLKNRHSFVLPDQFFGSQGKSDEVENLLDSSHQKNKDWPKGDHGSLGTGSSHQTHPEFVNNFQGPHGLGSSFEHPKFSKTTPNLFKALPFGLNTVNS